MRALIMLFLLLGCSTPEKPIPTPTPTPIPTPTPMPEPTEPGTPDKLPEGCLWIRGKDGNPLEPKTAVTRKEYCNLQLQGTGFVDGVLYGYATKTEAHVTYCADISSKISGQVKFQIEKNKYGTGVQSRPLTPMKSIAVDRSVIPYGSKVFIPALKDLKYVFEGKEHIHDGYVSADDTGGAIIGSHIDFFLGPQDDPYVFARQFPFVKSTSSYKFDAWVNGKKLRLWSTWYYLPKYKSCK